MKQKVLKGLKIVTRWLACAKSALVLGVIVALITWGMPLATPKFVAKVNRLLSAFDGDTDVVSLMFSSVISFVGIFISALLVYIQVYINRFPSELVLNQIKPRYADYPPASHHRIPPAQTPQNGPSCHLQSIRRHRWE